MGNTLTNVIPEGVLTLLHDDFESVFCQFIDPNNAAVAVSNPAVTVTSDRYDPKDPAATVVSGAALIDYFAEGSVYKYQLTPAQLDPGYYTIKFTGVLDSGSYTDVTLPVDLQVHGKFKVFESTLELDMTSRIRRKLKDLNTQLYRFDLPLQKWTDEEVVEAIDQALMTINSTPPRLTNYGLSNIGVGATYLLDLAYAQLVESYTTLEIANTATMSDGSANLTINRASMYQQLATAVYNRVLPRLTAWKKALVPRYHGQGGSPYPFRLRNIVAYLPNSKNLF